MSDLVSRSYLLSEYDRQHEGPPGGARKIIEEAPSAEQWIPCSERLPEERQWVLCQCRAKIMEVLRINSDRDWEQLYPRRTFMSSYVLAWMPLPEPYKENSND